MIHVRRSSERGYADHGWLKSFHSFSFAAYYDPAFMGWGNLRVINEDRIGAGAGFGTHSHRDMEIISYVVSGELAHRDSMGHVETIPPGDVQRMSAGTGVQHSEFNHAKDAVTHFFQIWLEPSQKGIAPGYEQKHFPAPQKNGQLCLVASPVGEHGSLTVHADARLYVGCFHGEQNTTLRLDPARKAYVQVVRGQLAVNDVTLHGGDALQVAGESELRFEAGVDAEVLVFDLTA
jgi:redox-sensitive bicupin YhaK (pirin superfamily)